MRLRPGITLAYADEVLRRAETTWVNARGAQDHYRGYTDAVHDTYPALRQVFAAPDLGGGLHSTAFWNLLPIGGARPGRSFTRDPNVAANMVRALRAENGALATEIENQVKALELARAELEELKKLAARPGLPVVYDTNMLNHWAQPGDVLWRDVFKTNRAEVDHEHGCEQLTSKVRSYAASDDCVRPVLTNACRRFFRGFRAAS